MDTLPPPAPLRPDPPGQPNPQDTTTLATPRPLKLRFTASGSEYFRIWIVNLLLIVVTLGLYLPFAKARRLRYFYANTLLDEQPLAFHGDPWKMFRGHLLMMVLFGAYALSGYANAWVALGSFVGLALLWPALWRSSLRFRLGNTSWRGLRFGFEGSVAKAYLAQLPLFVPGLILLAANAWFLSGVDQGDAEAMKAAAQAQMPWVGVSVLLVVALFPWALARVKRYQHGGYRYASQVAQLNVNTSALYWVVVKAFGAFILGLIAMLIPVFMAGMLTALWAPAAVLAIGLGGLLYLSVLLWSLSILTAGVQNLCWSGTSSQALEFYSSLHVGKYTRLQIGNYLLMVITLGLYRPFAVVNSMAMRLEAVSVSSSQDIDEWHSQASLTEQGAAGEMSGDFFGFEVGL